jgi:hypothetical protein
MSDKPMSQSRRDAVKLMLGGAVAVPFINLVGVSGAHAEDLPHVDAKTDPTAIALKYTDDATTATRPDKAGTPGAEQHCANCQFLQGAAGAYRPCSLFPGKAVSENGWCMSWTKKA